MKKYKSKFEESIIKRGNGSYEVQGEYLKGSSKTYTFSPGQTKTVQKKLSLFITPINQSWIELGEVSREDGKEWTNKNEQIAKEFEKMVLKFDKDWKAFIKKVS